MRAAFKRRVVEEMQKHQTTRRLLPARDPPPPPKVPREEAHLRENFSWQSSVVDALLDYSDAVAAAFDHLNELHEALMGGGVDAADGGVLELAELLSEGLASARELTGRLAAKARPELEARRSALDAWGEELHGADFAASEVRRYTKKLEALRIEEARGTAGEKFVSAEVYKRIKRNQQKLREVEGVAESTRRRAQRSLRVCASRRGSLCELVRVALQGTAEALQRAAWPAMQVLECPAAAQGGACGAAADGWDGGSDEEEEEKAWLAGRVPDEEEREPAAAEAEGGACAASSTCAASASGAAAAPAALPSEAPADPSNAAPAKHGGCAELPGEGAAPHALAPDDAEGSAGAPPSSDEGGATASTECTSRPSSCTSAGRGSSAASAVEGLLVGDLPPSLAAGGPAAACADVVLGVPPAGEEEAAAVVGVVVEKSPKRKLRTAERRPYV